MPQVEDLEHFLNSIVAQMLQNDQIQDLSLNIIYVVMNYITYCAYDTPNGTLDPTLNQYLASSCSEVSNLFPQFLRSFPQHPPPNSLGNCS